MSNQKALIDIYYLTGSREFSDFLEELRNLSEATMKYNFQVVIVPGKTNLIADYISRHPKWSSTQLIVKDAWSKDSPVKAIYSWHQLRYTPGS